MTNFNRLVLAMLVTLIVWMTTVPVQAAPIQECGDYGYTESGSKPIFSTVDGVVVGAGVYNITTRVVGCSTARRVVRRFWHQYDRYCDSNGRCRILGFSCRNRQIGEEFADVRCTKRGGAVVRFQHGA